MAEIERIDIVKLTISNAELDLITKALVYMTEGALYRTSTEDYAAEALLEQLRG